MGLSSYCSFQVLTYCDYKTRVQTKRGCEWNESDFNNCVLESPNKKQQKQGVKILGKNYLDVQ